MDSKNPDKTDLTPAPQPRSALEEEQKRLTEKAAQHVSEQGQTRATDALPTDDLSLLSSNSVELPFGTKLGSAPSYIVLPKHLREVTPHPTLWRIEFHGLTREIGPTGFDIVGDTVLGRGSGGDDAPDIDMETFGAFEQGVSRRHAMLRPSRNSLYLIDLNSTNGTWHNALRLGSGITRALAHNDTITLGRLTFTIKIIDRPDREQQTSGKSAPVEVKTAPLDPEAQTTDQKDSNPVPGELAAPKVEAPRVTDAKSAPPPPVIQLLEVGNPAAQPIPIGPPDDSEPPTIILPAPSSPPPTDTAAEDAAQKSAKAKAADAKAKPDKKAPSDDSSKTQKPTKADSKPKA